MMRAAGIAITVATVMAWSSDVNARCFHEKVTVFSAHWCGACKRVERYLAAHNIAYDRIETTNNPMALRFMSQQFGTTAVPVVIVGREYRIGFDQPWLGTMLCIS